MAIDRSKDHYIDPWSYLDYKGTFGREASAGETWLAPQWVGSHFRRLQAYKIYEDYCRNGSRKWLKSSVTVDDMESRREYGEPGLIVETSLSSLLGDDQSIVVPEAITEVPEPGAIEYSDTLLDWSEKEQLPLKIVECERTAVKLGDGVYVLGWNEELNRPRLHVYNPGFYFPVLEDDPSDRFPKKVHIAYEFTRKISGKDIQFIRRLTWELVDTGVEITYPWNESTTPTTCYYTDAEWRIDDLRQSMDDLTWASATVHIDSLDLKIDFIPVVHIPNTVALEEHYGMSVLGNVMQILDDVISTDTDLQAASATTGSPPIALTGSTAPKNSEGKIDTYGPGTVFETGDGSMNMLDTSRSLDALLKYDEHQLSRLSVNARIPESLLGRVKPNEVPSGIALTLSFSPHSSMIKEWRLVRREKYGLLLKFVGRYFQANGLVDKVFPADIHFGSFLPADRQETMTMVVQLLALPAISLETAVNMLVQAGFPIEDAVEEVRMIRLENFKAAGELLDATGDQNAVRQRLGLPEVDPALNPVNIAQPPELGTGLL